MLEFRYAIRIKKGKTPQYHDEIKEVLMELEYLEPPL
jgi:hypothetical protein